MKTAARQRSAPTGQAPEPVGELLYRFEADLEVTPIGLAPDGIRMTVDYGGRSWRGCSRARACGAPIPVDPLDGVGVVDTAKTIAGEARRSTSTYAYCLPPAGLELPAPEVLLDLSFEWPDLEFPIIGASTFRTGSSEFAHLNTTVAAIEGWANFATQRNAIETRVLRHTGTAAVPRRPPGSRKER